MAAATGRLQRVEKEGDSGMKELLRSNDLVKISWLRALLTDAGIPSFVLDSHTSVLEGSAGAIPRRLCVDDDDLVRARHLLAEAGEEPMP